MATPAIPNPDPTAGKPPRPRRWIPLSLRIFLLALVLLGGIGITSIGVRRYRQHSVVSEIRRMHGLVVPGDGGPDWLARLIGDDRMRLFDVVEKVYLDASELDDAGLARLKVLTELKVLSVRNTRVTDAGIIEFSRSLPNVDIFR